MSATGNLGKGHHITDRDFSKSYHPVIDYIWGYLPPTAKEIYPVMLRFADYRTRIATASQARIGRIARRRRPISQPQVSRTIHRDLVHWGLVRITTYWDNYGQQRAIYYLQRGHEIVQHLIANELVQGEVAEEFRRRYGEEMDEVSKVAQDETGELSQEDLLERLAEAANSINVDGPDVY